MLYKNLLRTAALLLLITLGLTNAFAGTVIVNSNITTNTTWTNANVYVVVGFVYVTNNATLTINAGTIIQGDSATLGSLIITRGAKISANGTACQPIVFTSEKAPGLRKRGDWGGLILLGYAQVNWPGDTGHIEGITPNPNTLYGGGKNPNCSGGDCPSNTDNSGTLKYVRIEFAGVALSPNNEINGLTMGGVGSGTTIEHVQVSYSNDDSYEWFGGTVNCKWLVAYDGIDDDFDTDNGFSGKIQFGLGMRDPGVADVSGSKSFESDNDPTGTTNTPQTSPVFNNMTCLGGASITTNPNFKQSAHIRRNSKEKIYNSIMMGFPQGLLVDGSSTIANCANSSFFISDYVQQSTSNYIGFTPTGDVNEATATANLNGNGNSYSTQYTGVIADPDFPASSANDFVPVAFNPLPSSNNTVQSTLSSFFTNTTYVGAFNPAGDTWAGDWTEWDPVNKSYGTKINNTPTITITSTTNAICPSSGAADITPSNGISPYSYSWSNGATTQDLSGVNKATYVLTLYDAGGACFTTKNVKVGQTKPILTSCSSTSTTITVFWSGNIAGSVSGYQVRKKLHGVGNYGPWTAAGNGNSFTVTGLLANTQYDFQMRGNCSNGKTAVSNTLTCSTTLRLEGDQASSETTSINAFPNPTTGEFKVQLNGFESGKSLNVKVTNVLGQVVYNVSGISSDNSSIDVNLGDVTVGLYSVEVNDGVNRYVQSVVLNK